MVIGSISSVNFGSNMSHIRTRRLETAVRNLPVIDEATGGEWSTKIRIIAGKRGLPCRDEIPHKKNPMQSLAKAFSLEGIQKPDWAKASKIRPIPAAN